MHSAAVNIEEINYELPSEQIALHPAEHRQNARLMDINRRSGEIQTDGIISDLVDRVQPGDVWVINDTKVRPARLYTRKESGGRVELLIIRAEHQHAEVMVRSSKPLREGQQLLCETGPETLTVEAAHGQGRARIRCEEPVDALLERNGEIPLPPYIQRDIQASDKERYQTVYATHTGAVAAPTAGLHFTPQLMAAMESQGARFARVTLHVGPGTFQPIRTNVVENHTLEAEETHISLEAAETIAAAQRVVAVGTTSVRCLEGAAAGKRRVHAGQGATNIYCTPGFQFQVVDALLTNFHLPKSSLIALVAAFAGLDLTMSAYRKAVVQGFRFYSYGDSMLLV